MSDWKKRAAATVAGLVVTAGVASAQSTVNQGKSGTEGGWQSRPHVCSPSSPHTVTSVTADAGAVPATPSTKKRAYTVICNSKQNASGNIKCRVDGPAPTFAAGNAGDYLANGDCIKYTTSNRTDAGSPAVCISDTAAGVSVTTFECLF